MPAPLCTALMRAASTLVIALLASGLAVAPARAADATVGIAAAPAQQGVPDGRTRFSFSVAAGQEVADALLVRNAGTADQQVRVYATDAFDTEDGAFAVLDRAATPTGAGTWVAFDGGAHDTTLALAAGAQALVPFTVTVPADASPGDHPGGIVVSVATTSGSTTIDRRVATRLYVRVHGTVQPALVVRSVEARQPLGGNPFTAPTIVTAVVANTGDVALSAHVDASVRTWFGRSLGARVSTDLAELLPGASRRLTFDVGSVGRVGYLAPHVTLTPAADADAYDFALPSVAGRGDTAAVPWLVVAVVVALVAWLLVRRRRRARTGVRAVDDEPREATTARARAGDPR